MSFLDNTDSSVKDSEVSESKKVHFKKPKGLKWSGRKLSHSRSWIFWWWLERTKILHRFRSNDHGTCMDSELTDSSFELEGGVDYFCIFLFCFIEFFEFTRFFECFLEGNSWTTRNEFCKIIHILKGDSESSSSIFYSSSRGKCAKSTNLCNMIFSIFRADIRKYLISSFIRKIHIDIWHTHTSRIQESFKKKSVFEWIYICNSRKICEYRTSSRTSSRSDRNSIIFSIPDKVSYNTKISIKSHEFNDREFIFETTQY